MRLFTWRCQSRAAVIYSLVTSLPGAVLVRFEIELWCNSSARSAARVSSHTFVNAALRVGVVLDVALDRVHALRLFKLVRGDAGHRGSLGTADKRIVPEVGIGGLSGFQMFRR